MMMNRNIIKQILVYAGIVLIFAVLAYGFVPQVLEGKIVNQSDISDIYSALKLAIEGFSL